MNFFKLTILSLILCCGFCCLSGCSDDEKESTILFRPAATLSMDKNTMELKWQSVEGATEYIIDLYKYMSEDDIFQKIESYTTQETTYTISGMEWDERYQVKVQSIGHGKESALWNAGEVAITYPTKLGATRAIDNAAIVTWAQGGNEITALKVLTEDGEEAQTISNIDYASGQALIEDLTPETTYKICAYSGEEQIVSTYEGRVMLTTLESEDYDAQYGKDKWIDMRDLTDPDHFNKDTFWDSLEEGTTIILSGETVFHFGTRKALDKSVGFATAMTLGDNAKFLIRNAFTISQDVASLSFRNIDFVGVIDDNYNVRPIEEETSRGFSAKQVCNLNNTSSTLENISFDNCGFSSFRSLVRTQNASDGIRNILFKGCLLNGIGDQSVVTTSNQPAIMDNITFEDCTITNIIQLIEVRNSANKPALNIKDCTFCYAPLEGTGQQLLRVDRHVVDINMTNTIFGPPLSSENTMTVNKAGTQETRFTNTNGYAIAKSENCWKTNFKVVGGFAFGSAAEIGKNEIESFRAPAAGDFKITTSFAGETSAGAVKWRN